MDMNFEDVAIVFSQEEWELLDEAQGLLYCDVMLEVFALVSSVGCWHKIYGDEACSDQSVGESQVRASKTAPATQKIPLCKWCFSVLKGKLFRDPIFHFFVRVEVLLKKCVCQRAEQVVI
ncbi:zinc finger protein interacting with ribonucleoprotein K-like isoform X7 [Myotis lucifugus]|uniref:zinc finger protein interacting with ribonucleoprotein K-like isoform X7 n=1 Tax=Myotis lucifugus TaxID=59463 RepID=UPI000CCC167C|nr:zinc finger protein interacting with ribonucleoprotein K-like isoform X7 [Myotis lucifugus]